LATSRLDLPPLTAVLGEVRSSIAKGPLRFAFELFFEVLGKFPTAFPQWLNSVLADVEFVAFGLSNWARCVVFEGTDGQLRPRFGDPGGDCLLAYDLEHPMSPYSVTWGAAA